MITMCAISGKGKCLEELSDRMVSVRVFRRHLIMCKKKTEERLAKEEEERKNKEKVVTHNWSLHFREKIKRHTTNSYLK